LAVFDRNLPNLTWMQVWRHVTPCSISEVTSHGAHVPIAGGADRDDNVVDSESEYMEACNYARVVLSGGYSVYV